MMDTAALALAIERLRTDMAIERVTIRRDIDRALILMNDVLNAAATIQAIDAKWHRTLAALADAAAQAAARNIPIPGVAK